MNDQPWPMTFAALFGRQLEADVASAIEYEARQRINDLRPGEMSVSLRALSIESARKENKFPPTGEEIIQKILRLRRDTYAGDNRRQCAHCHSGWMSYRFYCTEDGEHEINGFRGIVLHPDDPNGGMPISCPCKCSMGDGIILRATHPDDNDKRPRTTRERLERIRDAVWTSRQDFVRQFTRDEGERTSTAALVENLTRHFDGKAAAS